MHLWNVWVCAWGCSAKGYQKKKKKTAYSQELALKPLECYPTQVLGAELRSSGVCDCKCWAISSVLQVCLEMNKCLPFSTAMVFWILNWSFCFLHSLLPLNMGRACHLGIFLPCLCYAFSFKPEVVGQAFIFSTQETETCGSLWVWGQVYIVGSRSAGVTT